VIIRVPKNNLPDSPDSDDLIHELVEIGKVSPGTAPNGGSHFLKQANGRAREIGQSLSELGGLDLMVAARGAIQSWLGRSAARELEAAWTGVGEWQE
jgi:hypothetical protein